MREFSVGDVVRRKDFLGMTLVERNKDYIVRAVSEERDGAIFRHHKDKGLYIHLHGIESHCFDEHNFIMVKKAVPDEYLDDDLFTI